MTTHQYFVYLLASATRRLYVGVTKDLMRRVSEHQCGIASRFTHRYGITRLVHVETTWSVRDAIAREKQIKGWLRCKKLALIDAHNPRWDDLSAGWHLRDPADPSRSLS
jgi:putative endonuclease